jgi:hydroxymethylpyrimidine/phosphomethylpyrimidine kinase
MAGTVWPPIRPQTLAQAMSNLDREALHLPTPSAVALTIAGSDSGGGAGIQADLKTFQTFGAFGTSVVTAITAQDTTGVRSVHPVPLPMVQDQIDVVVADLGPTGVKTGMLATEALVSLVAAAIDQYRIETYVLDPVMVTTSGHRLLEEAAIVALQGELLPRALLITPNLEEARILTGLPVTDEVGQEAAARQLVQMGARAALVKGGHGTGATVVDILWDGQTLRRWAHPRIQTSSTHGTGCSLSAGITAGLAQGQPLTDAVDRAVRWMAVAIATAPGLGRGHGPINHRAPVPVIP